MTLDTAVTLALVAVAVLYLVARLGLAAIPHRRRDAGGCGECRAAPATPPLPRPLRPPARR